VSINVNDYGEFGQPADSRLIECGHRRYVERKLPNGTRELRRESGEVLGEFRFAYHVRWAVQTDAERLDGIIGGAQ